MASLILMILWPLILKKGPRKLKFFTFHYMPLILASRMKEGCDGSSFFFIKSSFLLTFFLVLLFVVLDARCQV